MRRVKVACIVGVIGATLAAPASAGQVQRVPTQVRFYDVVPADAPPTARLVDDVRAYGKILAGKPKCANLRRLSVYDVREGRDVRLGTGFSDTSGYWSINFSLGDFDGGAVYARARRTKRGKNTMCEGDPSPTVAIGI
jgi:hypothetical protein